MSDKQTIDAKDEKSLGGYLVENTFAGIIADYKSEIGRNLEPVEGTVPADPVRIAVLEEVTQRLDAAMTYAYDVLQRPEFDSDDEDFLRLVVGYD